MVLFSVWHHGKKDASPVVQCLDKSENKHVNE